MTDTPDNPNFTKFDFDNAFFEVVPTGSGKQAANPPPNAKAPAAQRQPRTFKEAHEQGYQQGLLQGQAEGKQQAEKIAEQRFAQQAEMLQTALNTLDEHYTNALKDFEASLLGLLRHSLSQIISHAEAHYRDDILTPHIQDLLKEVQETQHLTLKLHPNATSTHRHILTQTPTLKLEPDPALGPADCLLEWQTGGLEKRLPQMLERLDNLLKSAGSKTVVASRSPTQQAATNLHTRATELLGPDDELIPELQPDTQQTEPPKS